MRAAIVGGTGTLGRHVARELRGRGHDVRVLSRSAPEHRVDLRTGEGLAAALDGCQVVVDASNDASRAGASATLVDGSRRLLAAGHAAGVEHHVGVSIVGCERLPIGYYRVKQAQERLVEGGPVPWSLVRSTQFHELIAWVLAGLGRWGVLPLPRARLQVAACAEVATAVADAAEAPPLQGRIEIAGPEILDLRELGRSWRTVTGRRALLVAVPLPGRVGRALRAGALTAEQPDVRTATGFATWLAAQSR